VDDRPDLLMHHQRLIDAERGLAKSLQKPERFRRPRPRTASFWIT
jgi:hypothetical protein